MYQKAGKTHRNKEKLLPNSNNCKYSSGLAGKRWNTRHIFLAFSLHNRYNMVMYDITKGSNARMSGQIKIEQEQVWLGSDVWLASHEYTYFSAFFDDPLFVRGQLKKCGNVEMSSEMNGKQLDTIESVNGHHNGPVSITVQLCRDDLAARTG